MTAKDKKLIEEANKLHSSEWHKIDENAADTPEAKNKLHSIMTSKYHYDESW